MTEIDQRAATPARSVPQLQADVSEFLQRIDTVAMEADLHREIPRSSRDLLAKRLGEAREALLAAYLVVAPWLRFTQDEAR